MTDKYLRAHVVRARQQWGLGTSSGGVDWDANLNGVDVDLYGTNAGIDINRNLTSAYTSTPVLHIHQDNASDDQEALEVVQDAGTVLCADLQGWCNIGYTTTQNTQSTVATGACRIVKVNNKWFWQVHAGSGTYKYLEISSSTTA